MRASALPPPEMGREGARGPAWGVRGSDLPSHLLHGHQPPPSLYFQCLSLPLPCKAFLTRSLSRRRLYQHQPRARRGERLTLGIGFALRLPPRAARDPPRTESCESRGRAQRQTSSVIINLFRSCKPRTLCC